MSFQPMPITDLDALASHSPWIWDGFLAPGKITLFTALWKSGKTTLLAHLLAQRKTGGALVGQAVAAGPSMIVSEEAPAFWRARHARLGGFHLQDRFIFRPFLRTPSPVDWNGLIDALVQTNRDHGCDLMILDPLSVLLPAYCESDAPRLLDALQSLHRLTQAGVAVLLVHHPRKARSQVGAGAHGAGLLQSFVDVILEMYPARPDDPYCRRRRLLGFSRDPATPRSLLIELNAEGTGYARLDEAEDDEFLKAWYMVRIALLGADGKPTRAELLAQWPDSFPPPKPLTLWRWLDRAFERGLVWREGEGTRHDPFRYFLPETMAAQEEAETRA